MRNRWIIAQLAVAAVVLVASLPGIFSPATFGLPADALSAVGSIQAFTVLPGLVLSLVVNALLMGVGRAPAPSTAQKVLLSVEFALVAALLLFHFYTDPAGNTFGLAILTWPILIALAVAIAVLAIVRRPTRAAAPAAPPAG